MNPEVQRALKTFVSLLPEHFPNGLGSPHDLHRWMEVCYKSCVYGSPVKEEELSTALKEKFHNFDEKCIEESAKHYMDYYETYSPLLDYLKSNGYLINKQ
ncbi:MAG: hypothetical protein K2L16_07995 [Muribaculaceae bacterium]|nr:hypothetical protein [Muribaculaceae bacterium]